MPDNNNSNLAEHSSVSGWVLAVVRTISAAGVDPAPLLEQAGIDASTLIDPEARIPIIAMSRLWQLAIDASGDEALGLRVPEHIDTASLFDLNALILAAPSAAQGWNLFERYMPALSTGINIHLEHIGELSYAIIIKAAAPQQSAIQAADATTAAITRNLRAQRELGLNIHLIELARAEPEDCAEFERLLGAPVHYAQPQIRIGFTTQIPLHVPQKTADPLLEQALEFVIKSYLDRMQDDTFAEQVRREVVKIMTAKEPSLERIAECMHVSSRTLQRRLVAEDTSYRNVINEVRQGMALRLVRDTHVNFTDIAYQLGFRDASNFSRVFRRWFGATPSDFRRKS